MFYSDSFTVLAFTYKFMIDFQVNFCIQYEMGSNSILFNVYIQLFQHYLLKSLFSPSAPSPP